MMDVVWYPCCDDRESRCLRRMEESRSGRGAEPNGDADLDSQVVDLPI